MTVTTERAVFDYRALRLTVGVIAFLLPIVVTIVASRSLESISASYYTDARDIFVGMLFIVAALLFAYNGHTLLQACVSKIAAIAAALTALFPISCSTCLTTPTSIVHYSSAAILFSILTWFCLGPFRTNTRGKGGKRGLRSRIYLVCGLTMVGSMLCIVLLPKEILERFNLVFWAESIALSAFGVAWVVAGKYLRFLVDEEQALHILHRDS